MKQDVDLAILLAACEVKAKRWPGAAEHLAYALRVKSDPEERKGLEPTFVDVRRRVGGVKVTVTLEGADVFVGEDYAGQSPLAAEVYVLPGRTRVTAKKPGYAEVAQMIEVEGSGTAEVTLDLAGESDAGRARPVPTAPRSRTPAFVLGGLTLVAVGVGAALIAAGAAKGSAADSLVGELQGGGSANPCPGDPRLRHGCRACDRGTTRSLRTPGIGVLGVGGALLGATIIYELPPGRRGRRPAPGSRSRRWRARPAVGSSCAARFDRGGRARGLVTMRLAPSRPRRRRA